MGRYISASNEGEYVVKAISGVKRSAEPEEDPYKKQKKFHLVDSRDEESYTSPPAAESSEEMTDEEHVSLGDIMHEANLIGIAIAEESTVSLRSSHHILQSAPFELPVRPLPAKSSLLPAALATVVSSSKWDEQEEYDEDDEQFAIDYAMGLPIFNPCATDITKMLSSYDPHEDAQDGEERFGEPREDFHSHFYKMVGLNADGEEISDLESVSSWGDEFDSEEDESEQSEWGDEEIDRAFFIGDDDEKEEWDEHEYSETELDAEGGVSASGDEETELECEDEDECNGSVLYN